MMLEKEKVIEKLISFSNTLKEIEYPYPNDLERSKVWMTTDKMTSLACWIPGWELDGDFETAETPYSFTNKEHNLHFDGYTCSLYHGSDKLSLHYRLATLGKLIESRVVRNTYFPNGSNEELMDFIRADGGVVTYDVYKKGLKEYEEFKSYRDSNYKNIQSVKEFSYLVNLCMSKSSKSQTKIAIDIINTILDSVKWKFSFYRGEWDMVEYVHDEPHFLINFVLTSELFGNTVKVWINPENVTITFPDSDVAEIKIRDDYGKKVINLTNRIFKKLNAIKNA